MHTILSSATKTVRIGDDQPFAIIGERINPTGRKIFQLQLRNGDLSRVEIDVKEQVAGGAMLLDVNMGAPLADETALMTKAVTLIQQLTDLPLVIDSSIIEVLDAGLAAYQGKALVNSVTAEDERLEAILPLVKKYGAAVIGLPNDEEEIPEEPARRVELARKLIHVATEKYKIGVEDIVIDPLAMPVGADTLHPTRTLETIEMLKAEFGVNMTLGASNVSFGMPDRHSIAAAFLPIAIRCGLTSAIMDARAPQIVRAVKAADLVLGRDEWGAAWIAAHRPLPPSKPANRPPSRQPPRRPSRVPRERDRRRGIRARSGQSCLQRTARAGSVRRDPVRRGQLERHRDRLHLRRPRHLQEVPDQDLRTTRPRRPAWTSGPTPPPRSRTAGGWPAAPAPPATPRWRCRR